MNKKIAVLILMVVAAVFVIVASLSISKSEEIRRNGKEISATVKGIRSNSKGSLKSVTVSFSTPDGKDIIATASTRQRFSPGDEAKIMYDPASPQEIDFGDTVKYNMRGVVAGGLMFIIGLYYFIKFSLTDSVKRKLVSSGKLISAKLVSSGRNERYNMGEHNPWVITCRWTDERNNKEYTFVSKDYTIDPAPFLNNRQSIDVYIEPSDPGKYFMDTSFMPKGNNTIG
jgi:hypothetical protein